MVPSQPRMAISVDLLSFYRALFEWSCDVINSLMSALHTHYSWQGFRIVNKSEYIQFYTFLCALEQDPQGEVVHEPFCHGLDSAMQWYDILQVEVKRCIEGAIQACCDRIKQEGPFKIKQVLSPSTYKLHLPPTWRMHPIFHASLLSTYQETPKHGLNFLSPPPSIICEEREYTIETIIAHWGSTSHWQFHVWWEGYSLLEDIWEPLSHLAHAKYLVRAYKARHNNVFTSPDSPWHRSSCSSTSPSLKWFSSLTWPAFSLSLVFAYLVTL